VHELCDKEAPNNKRIASDTSHYTSVVTFLKLFFFGFGCIFLPFLPAAGGA